MKLLILGTGSIGRRHALSARALGVEFAVMDKDTGRAAAVAEEAGAAAHFGDLADALSWRPDAVVIATPHLFHSEHARVALAAGADVLIEKPVTDRLETAIGLASAARRSGRRAFVVCNMRFHPAVTALKASLDRIGPVRYARAHYGNYLPNMRPGADYRTLYCARAATGGGVVLDAIHEIDYLMWFFGPVGAVQGAPAKLSDLDIDVEDFANIMLEHASGIRSVITMDYLRPWKRRGCEIVGERGLLLWQSEGKQPEHASVRLYDGRSGAWETLVETPDLDNAEPYVALLAQFLGAIAGRPHHLQTVDEAVERLHVALAARAQSPLRLPQLPNDYEAQSHA
jgi:predicted dehydrogenase